MSNGELAKTRRGDGRLLQAFLITDRLCAERVPASERLEAQLGRLAATGLVIPLPARRFSYATQGRAAA